MLSETHKAKARGIWPKLSVANLIPLMALALFGVLFARHISGLDGTAVRAALVSLSAPQWIAAVLFTALSFRAIGLYDILMHRVLRTGQPTRNARAAGVKAIALSQTLGFGILTSALVRWRCLPDFSAADSLRLSTSVSLSFLAALAVVTAIVVPLSGLLSDSITLLASGIAAALGLILLAIMAIRLGWLAAPISQTTLLALLLATAADTAFAAAALWVLWPEPAPFQILFAAYLVALGAGLLSNAPGGVGAFDLTLLALVPVSDDARALAAVLAFRIIYYALPAALALIGLIRPTQPERHGELSHPEQALAIQSAEVKSVGGAALLTLPCWGNGAILGNLPKPVTFASLRARHAPRAFYKCNAQTAARARAQGWAVLRCARDAIIDLPAWTTDGPNRRQLRRALAGFAASGLSLHEIHDPSRLTQVAKDWAHAHGGERGHSMGRFCLTYLRRQRVFAAFDGPKAVAFVSFHTGPVWTLDLMRHTGDLPNGVMHALVHAGIEAAQAEGAKTLSLASVPAPAPHLPFATRIHANSAGLTRFKSAFGPKWQPRYICARSWPHLIMTMITLAYTIHKPPPLCANTNSIQSQREDFSFAPWRAACDPISSPIGARPHEQSPRRPS